MKELNKCLINSFPKYRSKNNNKKYSLKTRKNNTFNKSDYTN